MKKIIATISNDWHLKPSNIDDIKFLVEEQVSISKEKGVKYFIVLGDVFDSRIAQREEVLTAFRTMIDIVTNAGLEMWVIPGNHDKTDYKGNESFLSQYFGIPGFHLVSIQGGVSVEDNLHLVLLPFWDEEIWIKRFEEAKQYISGIKADKILLTHIAVTGSRNNDGEYVSSKISTDMFGDFKKVLSGHYHDQQKIGDRFYHLPSIQQNNFGENNEKGFTVLYSDGSHELVKSSFKEYIKVKIDLENVSFEELYLMKKSYSTKESNVRFEIIGPENLIKSIRKEDFSQFGIDVKTKLREIENDIILCEKLEVIEHNSTTIVEAFKQFCESENLNFEQGVKYLKSKLNG